MACAASSSFWVLRTPCARSSSLWASAPTNSIRSDRSDSVVEPSRNSTLVPGPAMNASAARSSRRDCTVLELHGGVVELRLRGEQVGRDVLEAGLRLFDLGGLDRQVGADHVVSGARRFHAVLDLLALLLGGFQVVLGGGGAGDRSHAEHSREREEDRHDSERDGEGRVRSGHPGSSTHIEPGEGWQPGRRPQGSPTSPVVATILGRCRPPLEPAGDLGRPGEGAYLPRSAASSGSRRAWRQW